MSARALNWAYEQKPATAAQKLVLIALADRADQDGTCWPSLNWLASMCTPVGVRSVRRAIDRLTEARLIVKTKRRRILNAAGHSVLGPWEYRLQIPHPVVATVASTEGQYTLPVPASEGQYEDPVVAIAVATRSNRKAKDSIEANASIASKLAPASLTSTSTVLNGHKPRPPDVLWDALVDIFGDSAVGVERGRWNVALKSFREAGATPDLLRQAALAYQAHPSYGGNGCVMTAMALAANWTTLTATPKNGHDLKADDLRRRIREKEQSWTC